MKVIVCRCEDVTLADLEHTFALGYRDLEQVKRYTGLGTGPCQGKECMAMAGRLCEPKLPFTSRPPLSPIPFRILAGD